MKEGKDDPCFVIGVEGIKAILNFQLSRTMVQYFL
jgi:hypothetical protein